MKRGHTVLEYKQKIRKLRAARPDISLSSDFIIGFPGETDKDFEQLMNLIAEIGFDQSFSFIYSARPGTPAAGLAMTRRWTSKKKTADPAGAYQPASTWRSAGAWSVQRNACWSKSCQKEKRHAGCRYAPKTTVGSISMRILRSLVSFVDVVITEALPNSLRGRRDSDGRLPNSLWSRRWGLIHC